MIEVLGQEGTSEHNVALRLAEAFSAHWKDIDKTPEAVEWVKIVAGAKISGYVVSDIDIVVVGKLKADRRFIPKRPLKDKNGNSVGKKPIEVSSFVIAVEVKDHDADRVKYNGEDVSVYYSRGAKKGWKSATAQNIDQLHALSSYLNDRIGASPFIYRCLVMNGLEKISVAGAVQRNFDIPLFLSSCLAVNPVVFHGGRYWMGSAEGYIFEKLKTVPIFKVMRPSNLDRRRMDAIADGLPICSKLLESLGSSMTVVRGHGGTGKTILLLHAAVKRFEQFGDRTLVLTYNLALASDIRRLLTLLGVPSDPDEGGVSVVTVMSHTRSWLIALGVSPPEEVNLQNYEKLCSTALDMFVEGAITHADTESIKNSDPDAFDFNNIFVDEAQDWPQFESDLLLRLYDNKSFIIADGIDQIIRGKRTAWKPVDTNLVTLSLDKSLRMKDNLARFGNAIAAEAGLLWEVKQNPYAGGGKVIIINSGEQQVTDLLIQALKRSTDNGNSVIDSLVCVPNSDVREASGKRFSYLAQTLESNGLRIWNGVDKVIRKNYPESVHQCRVLHYESCRGLEGWVTLLHKADQYWDDCYLKRSREGLTEADKQALVTIEEVASRYAWQRLMIAMTRPVDTLIISLSNSSSEFSSLVLRLAKRFSDIVELDSDTGWP